MFLPPASIALFSHPLFFNLLPILYFVDLIKNLNLRLLSVCVSARACARVCVHACVCVRRSMDNVWESLLLPSGSLGLELGWLSFVTSVFTS